jgi:hypothetical protein
VRAVELLKASLADVWAAPTKAIASANSSAPTPTASATAAPVRETTSTPRSAFASGIGLGIGAGVLQNFGALGATWAPDASLSYGWPHGLSLRVTVDGLGPSATLSAAAGSASLQEELALVEVVKTWWPRAPLVPFVCAGAGTQHTRITGVARSAPYQGHFLETWSLATALGAGVAIPLFAPLSLLVQGRALGVWPSTVVRIADTDAGRIDTFSLLADTGLLGVLQ